MWSSEAAVITLFSLAVVASDRDIDGDAGHEFLDDFKDLGPEGMPSYPQTVWAAREAELVNLKNKSSASPLIPTGLREFEDHAELQDKPRLLSEESMVDPGESTTWAVEAETTTIGTTRLPGLLPTPCPENTTETTPAEGRNDSPVENTSPVSAVTKKPSVPKKNVNYTEHLQPKEDLEQSSSVVPRKEAVYEGPSIVPKKGADPTPSVVPKKGADPTPSIVPKKGADPSPSVVPKKGADPSPSVVPKKGADPSPSVVPKKGADPSPSVVPKKGADPSPSVVPKKGADPSPSVVPKKGADPSPSVVPKKGADPSPSVVPKKGADPSPSVVPKKGADPSPSVVPKKGADPTPSVVPKKGVNLNSYTPSVFGRKGVELDDKSNSSQGKETNLEQSVGPINSNADSSDHVEGASHSKSESGVNNYDVSTKEDQQKPSLVPTPVATVGERKGQTVSVVSAGNVGPAQNGSLKDVHSPKPTVAVDDRPLSEDDGVSYGEVLLGLIVVTAILLSVVVGYRKLQEVWSRRQYARVDFLIDGMYDI